MTNTFKIYLIIEISVTKNNIFNNKFDDYLSIIRIIYLIIHQERNLMTILKFIIYALMCTLVKNFYFENIFKMVMIFLLNT
jgi:hypothetical protein